MNELTREASKQTILEAISFLWLGGRGRVRKSRREPQKPLKGHPRDYLTGLMPSGEYISYFGCHDDYEKGFMEGHSNGMADGMNILDIDNAMERFKQECREIDNE